MYKEFDADHWEHVINWEWGSPNQFGEPLPQTTLQYGPNGLNGQCHQVLPGLSIQSLHCLLFCYAGPEKSKT